MPRLITTFLATEKPKPGEKKYDSISYPNFENAMRAFLDQLDSTAIFKVTEPKEVRKMKADREPLLIELDLQDRLVGKLETLKSDPLLVNTKIYLDHEQALAKQSYLRQEVEHITSQIESLTIAGRELRNNKELKRLVRLNSPEIRLPLKAEIAKRISRIGLKFMAAVSPGK